MKRIKENDINDELEIFVENNHFVIKEKMIHMKGG